MKKILAFCLTALLALPFVGCSKDDKEDNASLMGSKWVYVYDQSTTEDVDGVSVAQRFVSETLISFNTKNNCTIRYKSTRYVNGKVSDEESTVTPGTYTYDGKSKGEITTTFTNEESGDTHTSKYTFSIAGNKLSLTPESNCGDVETVFTRQ